MIADSVAEADVEPGEREHDGGDEGGERRDDEGDEHLQQPAAPASASADPEDGEADDEDEDPAGAGFGPERGTREKHDQCGPGDREADQRPGPLFSLSQHLLREGAFLALARHDERSGEIHENSCPSEQGENDEADAKDGRVELEVAAEPAADAGEHFVRRAPLEPPHSGGMCDLFGHDPSLPGPPTHGHPDFPCSDPHPQVDWASADLCGAWWHQPLPGHDSAVAPDGEGGEHERDPDRPGRCDPRVVSDRVADEQTTDGVDHHGERVVLGDRLQPARHR